MNRVAINHSLQGTSDRAKRRKQRHRAEKYCDPAMCDNCIYIGEGDFICARFLDEDVYPPIVISEWEPTEHFAQCL